MREMVDRDAERRRLEQAVEEAPQLVVMRGRRRVGKSFLIDRALQGRRLVSYQADQLSERGHLEGLAREAARLLPGSPPLSFPDWDSALTFFETQAEQATLAVVLDEFQWMVQAQPALPSILQRHWDRWERAGTPLSVVLSGSALTLMEHLLDHGSPLFGRASYRPLIQPLDYRQSAEFAPRGASPEALLQRHAILGGTPQYQIWAGDASVRQVIRDRILGIGESLYEEPLHLLRAEQTIRDPGTYFAVLAVIARGAAQFNDIRQRAAIERNLDVMLGRLADLGYVERRLPVEVASKKPRGTYRVADPFFRFWFRHVLPSRSRLERGRVDEVLQEIHADLDTFMGPAFEDCCRAWVGRHADRRIWPASATLGSWWSRDGQTEIDIAGMTGGRYDLLGSCKWSRSVPPHTLGELLAARDRLGRAAAGAKLALFGRGFAAETVRRAAREGVDLVSAAELFRGPPGRPAEGSN